MAYSDKVYQGSDPPSGPPPSYEASAGSLEHRYITSDEQLQHVCLPQQQQHYPAQSQRQFHYQLQWQNDQQQQQQLPTQGVVVTDPRQPGQNVIYRQGQVQPNDYLAFAIIVTICCCLPLGIVAIIKSTEVRNRFVAGDYEGAAQASRAARNWSIAGMATGIAVVVAVILVYVVAIAIAATSY